MGQVQIINSLQKEAGIFLPLNLIDKNIAGPFLEFQPGFFINEPGEVKKDLSISKPRLKKSAFSPLLSKCSFKRDIKVVLPDGLGPTMKDISFLS